MSKAIFENCTIKKADIFANTDGLKIGLQAAPEVQYSESMFTDTIEVDLIIDPSFNTYDILNEIRALKRVTIVTVITPEDYNQSAGDEYIRLRMKLVTRVDAQEALQSILDDAISSKKGDNVVSIQGIKTIKYREGTLKRMD